jgi:hypothetical protein
VLHDLFTEIARAGAGGPLQPPDIILLDPISMRYLCFNPDGTGRIVDSPDRERFEHLYRLLHGLQLARIRECGSCKRLFWARRKHKIACSRPCANRLRSSKFYYKVKQQGSRKRPPTLTAGPKQDKAAYDDGGLSGGTMERPALQRLLADINEGTIDVAVVYKVDRLTRSLADFAKMVEVFDARGVSFVAVTQQFNTTTSMGRLRLNVLLSFAQFEREVTAARTATGYQATAGSKKRHHRRFITISP